MKLTISPIFVIFILHFNWMVSYGQSWICLLHVLVFFFFCHFVYIYPTHDKCLWKGDCKWCCEPHLFLPLTAWSSSMNQVILIWLITLDSLTRQVDGMGGRLWLYVGVVYYIYSSHSLQFKHKWTKPQSLHWLIDRQTGRWYGGSEHDCILWHWVPHSLHHTTA